MIFYSNAQKGVDERKGKGTMANLGTVFATMQETQGFTALSYEHEKNRITGQCFFHNFAFTAADLTYVTRTFNNGERVETNAVAYLVEQSDSYWELVKETLEARDRVRNGDGNS